MGKKYQGYKDALSHMNLDSLKERREKMALKFIKKILETENILQIVPSKHKQSPHEKKKP